MFGKAQVERIKLRYEQGFYTNAMVRALVKKGLTKEQYTEITGEKYE